MAADRDAMKRVKTLLKFRPRGLTITDIARQLHMNRNSVAKYLDMMVIAGEADVQKIGAARVFFPSHRVPLSALLSFSSDLVIIMNKNLEIIQVNDTLCNFFGIAREDLIGTAIYESSLPFVHDAALQTMLDGSMSQEAISEIMCTWDNKELYVKIKVIPTVFDDGNEGITLIVEDITGQKMYRKTLEISEARYRAIVEDQTELICRFLPDFTISFVNEAYCRYYESSCEEIMSRGFMAYSLPEDRTFIQERVRSLNREHPVFVHEYCIFRPDSDIRWQSWVFRALFDDEGNVVEYQGVGRDVTQRREAEDRIRHYLVNMEFLSASAIKFVELQTYDELFRYIGEGVKQLVPRSIVLVHSYNEETDSFSANTVIGDDERVMGKRELLDMFLTVSDQIKEYLMSRKIVKIHDTMSASITRDLSDAFVRAIRRDSRIKELYVIGLAWKEMLFGSVAILTYGDVHLENAHVIETFIRLASIALQKKIAEEELCKSNERLINVADLSPFPLSVINSSGEFLFINRKFAETFGYTLNDISTVQEWAHLAFPDSEYGHEGIPTCLLPGTGTPDAGVCRIQCRDGSFRDIITRSGAMPEGDMFTIYEDVTEQRKARQDLQESEERYRMVVESQSELITRFLPDTTHIFVNQAYCDYFGKNREEIIGSRFTPRIPKEEQEDVSRHFSRLTPENPAATIEHRIIMPDGKVRWHEWCDTAIFDEGGALKEYQSVGRDVTKRRVEERLMEMEEQYREEVQNINVGIYRSTGDLNGHFVWGNPVLFEIFGYSSLDDLQDIPIMELFMDGNGRKRFLEELMEHGFVKNRELHLKKRDGRPLWVSVTALAEFSPSGGIEFINGIVEDITGRKKTEEALSCSEQKLQDVIEFLTDPTFVVDRDGRVVAWNSGMEELTGVGREDILGKSTLDEAFSSLGYTNPVLVDLIGTGDPVHAREDLQKDHDIVSEEWYSPALNDGNGAVLLVKASRLLDREGNCMGAIESIRDITSRKMMEDALHTLVKREQ
jgi:PAS domain S-box-containing protein